MSLIKKVDEYIMTIIDNSSSISEFKRLWTEKQQETRGILEESNDSKEKIRGKKMDTKVTLEKQRKNELIQFCKSNNIKSYSGLNKAELIRLIEESGGESKSENKLELTHIPKPILKWVGGKSQILNKLLPSFPTEINNYHEIFVGGGSVLIALLSYIRQGIIKVKGAIKAYDLNETLIYVYKNIQTNHEELYRTIRTIIDEYNLCTGSIVDRKSKTIEEAKTSKESYYYWIRNQYNKNNDKKTILASSQFIFLNKTCFRGLYREGSNGFNVPYGHYDNPEIINKSHLDEIQSLIQPVIFECCDFEISVSTIRDNDFVYFDPPYAPENSTSFVCYNKTGFNIENHNKLFELIKRLNNKFMMSNADVSLVRENFSDTDYNIESILCKRSINSKNPNAKANEVIIKNY
jgi:DNA adenine methylase